MGSDFKIEFLTTPKPLSYGAYLQSEGGQVLKYQFLANIVAIAVLISAWNLREQFTALGLAAAEREE